MSEAGKLQRVLGAGFGVAVTVGATIGPGILRTPGEVAGHLWDPALIFGVWIGGAVYALLGALVMAELGTSVPQAGGYYVFVRRAFGDLPGFAIGWCDWLGQSAAAAFSAVLMGEWAVRIWPSLGETAVAMFVLAVLTTLQWIGLQSGAWTQNVSSLVKALAFFGFIGACFLGEVRSGAGAVVPGPVPGLLAGLVLASQAVFFTYDGWYSAMYFSEENRDPVRDLPRATLVGVGVIAATYLLFNGALLRLLEIGELAASKLPAEVAAERVFGASGPMLVAVLVLVAVPAVANGSMLLATRVMFAMSRDGVVSGALAGVSNSGTPRAALAASAGLSMLLVLSGTMNRLLAIAGFCFVLNYTSAYLCQMALRLREPDLPRPFRTPGYPWTTAAVLAASLVFLAGAISADRENSFWAVALLLGCLPVRYFLSKRR